MYAYLISGDNKKLPVNEILALSKSKSFILDNRLIIINKKVDFKRLSYVKKSYNIISIIDYNKDLEKEISKLSLNKTYKKDFAVRKLVIGKKEINLGEKELSSIIWRQLKKPKVNLDNPKTRYEFIFTDKKIYLGLLLHSQNISEMVSRWPQNRPAFHPTSMTPQFAMMLVNLSGAKKGDLLLDPFCGVGGILLEAGIVGCKILGYDKDRKMVFMAKKNLDHYKIKNYKIIAHDALKINQKVDFIVTDVPYGLHSKLFGEKTINLASSFLDKSYNYVNKKGRVVLVCPHNMKLDLGKYKLVDFIDHYIHGSLTRRVYILEK